MPNPQSLISQEELPFAREDKIRKDLYFLENKRSSLISKARSERDSQKTESINKQIFYLEKDICYVQRELEVRQRRKEAHKNFLEKRKRNRANSR